MAKYKVNLEKVWNSPICPGHLFDGVGYCAIGLVQLACLGKVQTLKEGWTPAQSEFIDDLGTIGFGIGWAVRNFDVPIELGANKEVVRERCVRQILQRGMETGLFELEDSDLQIVRDLKAAAGVVA